MNENMEYSAKLTGESFLLYEFKVVAKLKKEGFSDKEIRKRVLEENLFQYKFKSSISRRLSPLIKRVNSIDDNLLNMLLEDPLGYGVIINLYTIMKNDRLFFEFMDEVIREKIEYNYGFIEKKDINIFFTAKAEQSDLVSGWSEQTIAKLKQVIFKILSEAGMIEDIKTGKINRLLIPVEVKDYLISIGEKSYIKAMGEYIE
ncbi:DUF1819 family protein [Clostridium sp. ATCC 25772]|uniref:DUF1819 family protein n=1 Tax=Clostridium sp. ATCC 25772 TaxID=1676991 RepID=UPI000780449D|nr:DUF1819 family protein [Clostridium sp. ATCC 25772]